MKKKGHFVPVGTNRDKRVRQPRGRWQHLLSRLVLPTGTKGPLLSRLPDPGQKGTPFVPDWRSRLGNWDNSGFPTGSARPGQKGALLSRVWQPGQKNTLLSWLVLPTETKSPFFSCFSFLNSFSISIILLHFN